MAYTGNIYENLPRLESLGEMKVRELLPTGEFGAKGSDLYTLAEAWLASKESVRKVATEARSETRDEASLSIARDANSLSRKALSNSRLANIISIVAITLSTITAIFAASDKVILFLRQFGILKG